MCRSPRSLFLVLFLLVAFGSCDSYKIPAPLFAVHTVGLEVSIDGAPGIELVVFHGRCNRALKVNEPGEIFGEVTAPNAADGRWTYSNTDKQLVIGDVLHYWIYVQHRGVGYRLEGQQFTVREFDKNFQTLIVTRDEPLPPPLKCDLSETRVNGEFVCRRSVVFEDNFDSVDYKKWEPVVRFSSDYQDAEFNSYQNRTENYYVQLGMLVIAPTLQSAVPGFNDQQIRTGKLDFGSGCTSENHNEPRDCSRQAGVGYIVPPVVSAKIRTKNHFRFRYGEVTVRAKVPKGDWLFPELYLESADPSIYGPKLFASGQMRFGFVRGNERLTSNGQDIDGTRLNGVLVLSQDAADRGNWAKSTARVDHWGNDFHNYTVTWSPTSIQMSVDGQLYANFRDPFCTVASQCSNIETQATAWKHGGPLAPFDQDFYISLGVGVGGLGDFPDGSKNGVVQSDKPWENSDNQAERKFYGDLAKWKATWTDQSVLKVDHIKVTAL